MIRCSSSTFHRSFRSGRHRSPTPGGCRFCCATVVRKQYQATALAARRNRIVDAERVAKAECRYIWLEQAREKGHTPRMIRRMSLVRARSSTTDVGQLQRSLLLRSTTDFCGRPGVPSLRFPCIRASSGASADEKGVVSGAPGSFASPDSADGHQAKVCTRREIHRTQQCR